MARDYTLDTSAAIESNSGGKRIKDPGIYSGKILHAWYELSPKRSECVQILFKSDSGQEVGPLAVYTHNANGEPLIGYNLLNAILMCAKVHSMSSKPGMVELYDFDVNKTVSKQKEIYTELTNKPIGLALRAEEYENRNKELKEKLIILAPFDPATKLTADEIIKKELSPKSLERIAAWIEKEPVKRLKRKPADPYQQLQSHDLPPDDDIPF